MEKKYQWTGPQILCRCCVLSTAVSEQVAAADSEEKATTPVNKASRSGNSHTGFGVPDSKSRVGRGASGGRSASGRKFGRKSTSVVSHVIPGRIVGVPIRCVGDPSRRYRCVSMRSRDNRNNDTLTNDARTRSDSRSRSDSGSRSDSRTVSPHARLESANSSFY